MTHPNSFAHLIFAIGLLAWRQLTAHLPETKHENIWKSESGLNTRIPVM